MTQNLSSTQIKSFQKKILSWYKKNKRDLPWRDVPLTTDSHLGTSFRDPYAILISEVMAQQTQLSRIVPKYLAWMERFPTLQSLAEAPTQEVLKYWSGLGYNRRALYLKKLAEQLVEGSMVNGKKPSPLNPSPHGRGRSRLSHIYWPQTEEELKKLPGIGEYTARAILCFAFDQQVAVVDTNVKKVILTQFSISNFQFSKKDIQEIADQLLPKGQAYTWNQALMDYAQTELKEHKIPIPKQSRFKDSDRYYRGQIIKMLIEKKKVSQKELYHIFKENISEERFQKVLQTLEEDGFISLMEGIVEIS